MHSCLTLTHSLTQAEKRASEATAALADAKRRAEAAGRDQKTADSLAEARALEVGLCELYMSLA